MAKKRVKIRYEKPPESLVQFEIDRRVQFLAQTFAKVKDPNFAQKHPKFPKGSTYAGRWAPTNKGAKPDPIATRKVGAAKSGAVRKKSGNGVATLPANPTPSSTRPAVSSNKVQTKVAKLRGNIHPDVQKAFESLPSGHEHISKGLEKLAGSKVKLQTKAGGYDLDDNEKAELGHAFLMAHALHEGTAKPGTKEVGYDPEEGGTSSYYLDKHKLVIGGIGIDPSEANVHDYNEAYGQFVHEMYGHGTQHKLNDVDKKWWENQYSGSISRHLGTKGGRGKLKEFMQWDNPNAIHPAFADATSHDVSEHLPSGYAGQNPAEFRAEHIRSYAQDPKHYAKEHPDIVYQLNREGIVFKKSYMSVVNQENLEGIHKLGHAIVNTHKARKR